MGHGAWMGIAWGNMEHGWMRPKHSYTFWCDMFRRLGLSRHQKAHWATRHVLVGGRFEGSCFEVHVLWCTIFGQLKWTLDCHWNTRFCVNLVQGPCCPCVETRVGPLRSEQHIYDLFLK
jgi:hypothetical protein